MTASAPEEGVKCWLKVTHDGKTRMVEWNTAGSTFKDMDTKVRKMFGLNDKVKLVYIYQHAASNIIMSSDEELSTALQFLNGAVLNVNLSVERKRKKGPLCRLFGAAKAQQPRVTQFITSLPANIAARVPSAQLGALAERMRASAQACCAARCRRNPNANADPNAGPVPAPTCRVRSRKILLSLFVLLAAFLVVHHKCSHSHFADGMSSSFPFHMHYHSGHQFHHGHHGQQNFANTFEQPHVTILAASYGGHDVTRRAQEFYNQHNHLQASNQIFGDTAFGQFKYLHVVFQRIGANGLPEVFSQSLGESDILVPLKAVKQECFMPELSKIGREHVRILGALYDGNDISCATREFATAGRFEGRKANPIQQTYGNGAVTIAYMKNNKVHMVTALNGQKIVF